MPENKKRDFDTMSETICEKTVGEKSIHDLYKEKSKETSPGDISHYSCAACLELCVRPISLVCGHTLCLICLYRIQYEINQCYQIKKKICCPQCRQHTVREAHFGIVYPLQHTVKLLFPQEYQEKMQEENDYLRKLQIYKEYSNTRFPQLFKIIRSRLRYRPIISYDELLEWLSKRMPGITLNELLHVCSYAGVQLYDTLCISNAFDSKYSGFSSYVCRYALREYYANKDKTNISTSIPFDEEFCYISGKVMCLRSVGGLVEPLTSVHLNPWKLKVKDIHCLQSFVDILDEIALLYPSKEYPVIEQEKDIIQLLKGVYSARLTRSRSLDGWSTWEDVTSDEEDLEKSFLYENDYQYHEGCQYPFVSKYEIKIAKKRSPTIRNVLLQRKLMQDTKDTSAIPKDEDEVDVESRPIDNIHLIYHRQHELQVPIDEHPPAPPLISEISSLSSDSDSSTSSSEHESDELTSSSSEWFTQDRLFSSTIPLGIQQGLLVHDFNTFLNNRNNVTNVSERITTERVHVQQHDNNISCLIEIYNDKIVINKTSL